MFYYKCENCQSEWNSTVKSELCPFCGEALEMKKDLKTIDDVLTFIFSEYGIGIINEHRRFVAVLGDYAPQMNNERNLIKIALESGAYSSLVDANDKDFDEQQICFKRVQSMLEQQYFLSSDWVQKVLIWLTNYLGWSIKVENLSNAEINSIKEIYKSDTPTIEVYLKRVFIFLNDGEWKKADEYCEKILDINPECAEAYLGKLMIDLHIKSESVFNNIKIDFENNKNYQKVVTFGDTKIKKKLQDTLDRIKFEILEEERQKVEAEAERKRKDAEAEIKRTQQKEKTKAILESKRFELKKVQGIISVGGYHTVGLNVDGKVLALGNNDEGQCDVSKWTDIVAISAGHGHTVGLKTDGTVVATEYIGKYYNNGESRHNGQCNVSKWRDIVNISAGFYHTVGLKKDGTVVATEYIGNKNWYKEQCNVKNWTDMVAISAGAQHTIGLKLNGTVVAVGDNSCGQCNVKNWTDIVAVSAGSRHTVGLKLDGTVIAVGHNYSGQCNVSKWRDIVNISAGSDFTIGLKSDGTVVAIGENDCGQCNVKNWTDIVAVSAGSYHTVGLKSDGTVITVGSDSHGNSEVVNWKLFDSIKTLETERERIKEERKIIEEQMLSYRSKNLCQYCGGEFKGLFAPKCSNCGKKKDY